MKKILILGGTGFVGRHICEKLVRLGWQVTIPSRQPGEAKSLQMLPRVELVQANVHDLAALTRLLPGHDAVVNLVAILHGTRAQFERAHVALPQQLVQACKAAGVRRIVHVSALGIGPEGGKEAPSNYLRSKTAGEAVLMGSGLDVTVLRPSVIFGAHDHFINLFARLQSLAPVVPLAGSGARFQPVWVEDVAAAIVHCIDSRATIGQVYECAGPQVFTLSEIVRLSGRWSGHERPQIPLPAWAGKLQAAAMELLPGTPLMSRDNVDSMSVPNIASGKLPGLHDLGIIPAALQAVAPGYLGDLFVRPDLDRFRAGGDRT